MQHLSDFQTRLAMCVPLFTSGARFALPARWAPMRAPGNAPGERGLSRKRAPWISRSLLLACCGVAWGWLLLAGITTAPPSSGGRSSATVPGAQTVQAVVAGRGPKPLVRLGNLTEQQRGAPLDSCIPYAPSGCTTPRVPTPAEQLGAAAARVVWAVIAAVSFLWVLAGFYQAAGLTGGRGQREQLHLLIERLLVAGLVDFVTWHLGDVAGLVEATLNAHLHDPTVTDISLVGPPGGVFGVLFALVATALVEWFLGLVLLRLAWECLLGIAALSSLGWRALGATLKNLLFLVGLAVGVFAAPTAVNLTLGLFLN